MLQMTKLRCHCRHDMGANYLSTWSPQWSVGLDCSVAWKSSLLQTEKLFGPPEATATF